jgi:NAD(P)-dependent dehydrogenase (short-subunit alcohol dehydrogenase family)
MLLGPDRVAVVTGAASGIGRAPALHLAQKGCALALVDVTEDGLNETASIVALAGRKASLHVVDVSNLSQMQAFPEAVLRHHSAIHILVNNAGVSLASPFESATLEDMQWVVGINLWGAIYGCKFFLPYLRRESEAHILNDSFIFSDSHLDFRTSQRTRV